ncbi:MAG: rRNA maturation RNase YbeY [bacterium]|nr:rRNA maturation RNase YbeY [bacterium]
MFVFSGCKDFPLTKSELENLWQAARMKRNVADDEVAMRCVGVEEIQRLNKEYRNKDIPTNILTFSYEPEGDHDIAICMEVARAEAETRGIAIRDYVALLVTHAVLHVCGMDHEASKKDSFIMKEAEREILLACGFVAISLSDVY